MSKTKRLLSVTLASVMLFASAFSAFAEETEIEVETLSGTVTAEDVTVKPGVTEVEVPVTIAFENDNQVSPHGQFDIAAEGATLESATFKKSDNANFEPDAAVPDGAGLVDKSIYVDADGVNTENGRVVVESDVSEGMQPSVSYVTVDVVLEFATALTAGQVIDVVISNIAATNLSEAPWTGMSAVNGKITVEADEPETELSINGINRMKSLSLKDVVYINPTVAFVDVVDGKNVNADCVDKNYILENGKILFWDTNPGDSDSALFGTEVEISALEDAGTYTDTTDAEAIQEYKGKSMGIPAKNFGDTIYYRTYIVIGGKEYYGDIIEYSVQTYCYNQINSSKTTDAQNKLRALCATMLNFGSSAQIQLNYNVDTLSNSILPDLVKSGKLDATYLELNWDESLLVAANTPAESMTVNFVTNDAKITERTLQLKGAIEPKVTMGYKIVSNKATELPADADLTFYFWSSDEYETLAAAGTPLSKENAEYTRSLANEEVELSYTSDYGYEYFAKPEAIPARQLEQTFYFVAIVTEADGTEYCTGVNSYSPIQYAINQLAKTTTSSNEKLQDLCRWMVLYWDAAKTVLG